MGSLFTKSPRAVLKSGGLPSPPVEIADEAELYAREWGRHGSLEFRPTMFYNGRIFRGTWVVKLTLRPNDKRLKLWQEQKTGDEPTEEVWLHEYNPDKGKPIPATYGKLKEPEYRALPLEQLGAGGVRAFLERGNMWSGRGTITSPVEALKKGREDHATHLAKVKSSAKEEAGKMAVDQRRSRLKIPFLGVLKNLVK